MEKDAIPDFITQTDRFGNPSTPRSEGAIRSARNQGNDKNGSADIDACETLLDSIRLMCCCLVPEDPVIISTKPSPTSPTQVDSQLTQRDDTIKLLPPIHPDDKGKKCLVLDLDETLVHSSFRAVPGADFVIPVQVRVSSCSKALDGARVSLFSKSQIEDVVHFVYVAKRPGVDEFLVEMAKHYEIVVYTASLNKYADPLLDLLDTQRVVRARLFRESCVYYEGNYVKDLSLLDRDLTQSIIVDNSPNSYIFHPENAIDCTSFIDDPNDRELDQIGSFLTGIRDIKDVRGICPKWRDWPDVDIPEDSESPEYEQ
jgi:RNA polymerase II subunit A small phosphatase-like protein